MTFIEVDPDLSLVESYIGLVCTRHVTFFVGGNADAAAYCR